MAKSTKAAAKAAPAPEPQTALTVIERAVVALGYNEKTRKELTTLADGSKHIVEITNDDGYKQCHSARMVLKNTRVEIEKRGKTAREDAAAFSKAVIAEQNSLIEIISPEEDRLEALQTAHDEKVEREKQEQIEAEERRVTARRRVVEDIRNSINIPFGFTAAQIGERIAHIEAVKVDAWFEEFEDEARDAKVAAITVLGGMRDSAAQREAAEAEAARNRAELERLRAEAAAREKTDREKREADEAAERDRVRLAESEQRGREMAEAAAKRQAEAASQPFVARAATVIEEIQKEGPAPMPAPMPAPEPGFLRNTATGQPAVADRETTETAGFGDHEYSFGGTPATTARFAQPKAERPPFDEIVQLLAFEYGVEPDEVRTWICEAVTLATSEAA